MKQACEIAATALRIAAVFLLLTVGGNALAGEGPEDVMQWRGAFSGIEDTATVVATTNDEWRALWESIGETPPIALPPASIGVGVFLGQRNSGGYEVGPVAVALRENTITVLFEEVTPAPNALVAAAITTPYLIQLFPLAVAKIEAPE